jgi:hypothetical protein
LREKGVKISKMSSQYETGNLKIPEFYYHSSQSFGVMGVQRGVISSIQSESGPFAFFLALLVIVFALVCMFLVASGCHLCHGTGEIKKKKKKQQRYDKWLTVSKTKRQKVMKSQQKIMKKG